MSRDEITSKGKVIKSTRNHYLVRTGNKILKCVIRGKIAGKSGEELSAVRVGDNVIVTTAASDEGVIQEILPRRSKLSRTVEGKAYREHIIATKIDQMVVIMSAKQPAFKWGLLDRYLIIAQKNGLRCVICLNKMDLVQDKDYFHIVKIYNKLKYDMFFTSAVTGRGLKKLSSVLKDKVSILVGHSGVGKSSLLQKIEPGVTVRISEVSEKTTKGKHTTSFVELFPLSFGGYIIDTPGIRELGLWDIYRDELKQYFIEFQQIPDACQFNDCQHLKEPGCAVKEAVKKNRISKERYKNYQNIYADLRSAPYELIKRR